MYWYWIALAISSLTALVALLLYADLYNKHIPHILPPVQDDVRWAYRNVLGREPATRQELRRWARQCLNREELFAEFIRSEEFRIKPLAEQQRLRLQAQSTIVH